MRIGRPIRQSSSARFLGGLRSLRTEAGARRFRRPVRPPLRWGVRAELVDRVPSRDLARVIRSRSAPATLLSRPAEELLERASRDAVASVRRLLQRLAVERLLPAARVARDARRLERAHRHAHPGLADAEHRRREDFLANAWDACTVSPS